MKNNNPPDPLTIYTIGHSNHSIEKFLGLLKEHRIEVVVDIRSNPYSRFAPHYNKAAINESLIANGIKYLYLGDKLGGRPKDKKFYDSNGSVLYSRMADSPTFNDGIRRLIEEIEQYTVVLMCSEEDPGKCHRSLLVGRVLLEKGVQLKHIRKDGRIESEENIQNGDVHKKGQIYLFRSGV